MKRDEQRAVAGGVVTKALQRDLEAACIEALGPIGQIEVEHREGCGQRRGQTALMTRAATA
jgi:hypothetical protein